MLTRKFSTWLPAVLPTAAEPGSIAGRRLASCREDRYSLLTNTTIRAQNQLKKKGIFQ